MLQDVLKGVTTELITTVDFGSTFITGVTDNSKDIKEGYLFVAVGGYSFDGHNYINDAVRLGAAAVIGEREINNLEIPYLQVKNSRKALGLIAKSFYCDPSSKKIMIGITGTNGKTTISFMIKQILENSGISCSVLGTINYLINGKKMDSDNTTPGSIKLNSLLASSDDKVVVMEVSSHGLAQHRLDGIEFDYCIFTNLYHEHLDFHGSMEDYFRAKSLLFEKLKPNGVAILNCDDYWGVKLYEYLQKKKTNTYLVGKSKSYDLSIIDYGRGVNSFLILKEKEEIVQIHLPLPGLYNLYNASLAYPVARRLSIEKEDILSALNKFPGVPGRFELYRNEDGPTFVIDYAHTADAIFHTLQTAKEIGAKRIFHIFGFRGGRDKTKRIEMVKVSSELSDVSILTIDDLNTERLDEMLMFMRKLQSEYSAEKTLVIPDRTLTVQSALQWAIKDDWIILTGKGHESYKHTFSLPTTSDKETVLYVQEKSNRAIQ